jgi:hypothetical protein
VSPFLRLIGDSQSLEQPEALKFLITYSGESQSRDYAMSFSGSPEWADMEGGWPGHCGPQRNTLRHQTVRPNDLEEVERLSSPQPRRDQDAMFQAARTVERQITELKVRATVLNRYS